jgi:trans-2,3-dihydro-3-hydroxyanthranilate isomerase
VPRLVPFVQVDVFATRPFGGNPAGAVLDADEVGPEEMQSIAAETRLAGTAFVTRTTRPGHAFRLRYRSPIRELTYSGHTTLGGVHALLEAGRIGPGETVFDTPVGSLPVTVEPRSGGTVMWLAPAVEPPRPLPIPLPPLLAALGLAPDLLGSWAAPAVTRDTDMLVPVAGLAALHALRPDMDALGALASAHGLRGTCVVSRETVEPGSRSHCRFFAPHYGVPEDIVTGSVHSPLALWLAEAGVLTLERGRAAFTAEQGDTVGRPGRLRIEIEGVGGPAPRVRVGGSAVTVLTGTLHLA